MVKPSVATIFTSKQCTKFSLLLCITAIKSFTCVAFEFKLSTLFGLFEEEERFENPIYPRRNLVDEYGVDRYRALVSRALGQSDTDDRLIKNYGVDVSFPTHYLDFPQDDVSSSEKSYSAFLEGCRAYYKSKADTCDESEMDRLDRNLNQPPVMQVC